MNPFITKEHEIFRQKVRDFAENEIKPIAGKLDEEERFSPELTSKMAEFGLFGIAIPQQYGGQGLDYRSLVIAVEEIARVDGSQAGTVAAHNSLGIAPIYNYGTEEQKMKYLPMLCKEGKLWAFGLTEENAGSDSQRTETKAEFKNGNWHINGAKMFISNSASESSAGVTIQAVTGVRKDGKKELSSILLPKETPGFTQEKITNKLMWRASDTGRLYFDDVKVPAENLLGERGKGGKMMLETLDAGRLSIGAMGLGLAQGAYEMAMDYAKKREQFGKPIGQFQVNTFKLADMATKIELAHNTLYKATWLKDNNYPFGKESAMAKLYSSEIAREIADESLQIHGGYGLLKSFDIERFYRDQRILQIGEGTSEILRMVISRHIGVNK
jgi:alkylation response protein AidB-like acyl-CoA dehydrogenase